MWAILPSCFLSFSLSELHVCVWMTKPQRATGKHPSQRSFCSVLFCFNNKKHTYSSYLSLQVFRWQLKFDKVICLRCLGTPGLIRTRKLKGLCWNQHIYIQNACLNFFLKIIRRQDLKTEANLREGYDYEEGSIKTFVLHEVGYECDGLDSLSQAHLIRKNAI